MFVFAPLCIIITQCWCIILQFARSNLQIEITNCTGISQVEQCAWLAILSRLCSPSVYYNQRKHTTKALNELQQQKTGNARKLSCSECRCQEITQQSNFSTTCDFNVGFMYYYTVKIIVFGSVYENPR